MTPGSRRDLPQDRVPVASLEGASKSFPGVVALAGVSIELHAGEIHALLGENGAGKSTLINILSGVFQPDGGTVRVADAPVRLASPRHAQDIGVATIHQEPALAPDLTALQNIYLGREQRKRVGRWHTILDDTAMESKLRALCENFEFSPADLRRPVGELGALKQHVVEILKALSADARLVILDEPTSGLAEHEQIGRAHV